MRSYMQNQAIAGPWAAAERLLVCISPNPMGERLIRSARRLADELNAEWTAVYVQTPHDSTLPQQKRDMATNSLRLAEETRGAYDCAPFQWFGECTGLYGDEFRPQK